MFPFFLDLQGQNSNFPSIDRQNRQETSLFNGFLSSFFNHVRIRECARLTENDIAASSSGSPNLCVFVRSCVAIYLMIMLISLQIFLQHYLCFLVWHSYNHILSLYFNYVKNSTLIKGMIIFNSLFKLKLLTYTSLMLYSVRDILGIFILELMKTCIDTWDFSV